MFILFIVTLGFYRLYWLYKTRNEMVKDHGQKIPSFWLYVLIFVMLISSIVVFIGATFTSIEPTPKNTSYCNELTGECSNSSESLSSEPLPTYYIIATAYFYISMILVGPLMALWYWKYAKGVDNVTAEKLSFPLVMISLILIPDGFDILIIQDGFNKVQSIQPAATQTIEQQ